MGRPLMTCVGCADNRSHLASRHLLQVLLAISLFVAAAGPGVGSEEPSSSRPPAQPASPAAQIPQTPSPVRTPSSVASPSPRSTPSSQATPSPQPSPFAVPSLPGPSPVPSNTQRPAVSPSPPVSLTRSEEHTSELQSPCNLVCRLLLEKKKMLIQQDEY